MPKSRKKNDVFSNAHTDSDLDLSDAEVSGNTRDSEQQSHAQDFHQLSMNNENSDRNSSDEDEDEILRRITGNYRRFSQNQRSRDRLDELLVLNNNNGEDDGSNEDDDIAIQSRNLHERTSSFDDEHGEEDDIDEQIHFHYDAYDDDVEDDEQNEIEDPDDSDDMSNYERNENDYGDGENDEANFGEAFSQANALQMLASALGNANGANPRLSELEDFLSNRLNASANEDSEHLHIHNHTTNRSNADGLLFNSFVTQLMPASNSRIANLVEGLNTHDNAYMVLETLNEISSTLLMMNSIQSERQVPTRKLSESLVRVINEYPDDLELQLVACRCIYNLAEVNFNLMSEIISAGVIECLNLKLLDLSYIDMAEQALQALEIISRKAGRQCLIKGSVPIVLSYLDFFTIHAQRKALQIAAKASAFITKKQYSNIETVFPIIKNVATFYTDPQCVESSWKFISNTIKVYNDTPSLLQNLIDVEFLKKLCDIFPQCLGDGKRSSGLVSFKTSILLLDTLSSLAANSPKFSNDFICECNISQFITKIFSSYQSADSDKTTITIDSLMKVPKELLLVLLKFIVSIIPLNQSLYEKCMKQDVGNYILLDQHDVTINNEKVELSIQSMDAYSDFYHDVLPIILNIYDSTVEYKVRRLIFVALLRILSMMSPQQLKDVVHGSKIFSILASTISQGRLSLHNKENKSKDSETIQLYSLLFGSLLITQCLISGNPKVFLTEFVKEGLISQIKDLSQSFGTDSTHNDTENDSNSYISKDEPIFKPETSSENESHDEGNEENRYDDFDEEMTDDFDESDDGNVSSLQTRKHDLILKNGLNLMSKISIIECLNSVCASLIENCDLLMEEHNIETSDALKALKQFTSSLGENSQSLSYDECSTLWKRLVSILNPKNASESISSFELVSSGIVKQLLLAFGKEENLNTSFCRAFQDIFCSFLTPYIQENISPLVLLVNKLEESLDRNESFEIERFDSESTHNSRYRAASMTKQMKIKLIPFETDVHSPPKSVMLILHAIATFETIQNFIKNSKSINLATNFKLNSSSLDNDYHFEFYLNDSHITPDSTIFGAVYKAHVDDTSHTDVLKENILKLVHVIKYKAVPGKLHVDDKLNSVEPNLDTLASFTDNSIVEILKLLKILYKLNAGVSNPVSSDALFLNYKLSAKLKRQLDEPLLVASGILPDWAIIIPREFSFLFPLETRLFFLKSTSFGYSRLIDYWLVRSKDEGSTNSENISGRIPMLGRSVRHKLRISREKLFASAVKVMETYAANPGLLEIEFFDEVGSGLGPTLEFYSNVSKDFGKLKLFMWRSGQYDECFLKKLDGETLIHDKHGLFPRPMHKLDPHLNNTLLYFKVLGKFLARAFLDSRLVDFHFNPLFFEISMKYALTKSIKYDFSESISKIKEIDESLASSLNHLNQYLKDFETLPKDCWNKHTILSATVNDLMLSFVLPGYEEIKLIPNGDEIYVTGTNLYEYMERLIDFTLNGGIIEQIRAFVEGFSEIFPFTSLKLFSADELSRLSGTEVENWSMETLISAIHADHGYTNKSQQITWLIELMCSFDNEERRSFLKFITGSPRLPYDGFKALSPPFTVVLKHSEDQLKPDDYLPSVMTCANYLKLPQYSSYEIMRAKILHAMKEGNDSFLLS